jgi:transposase
VAFRWDFQRSGLFFQTRPGSYNDLMLIEFLNDLKREFRGRRVVLIWDGLPSHKSGPMQAYLRAQRSWLTVERLPGYAPDLNPAELLSTSFGLACAASAALTRWHSAFSDTPGFLFDRGVTVLCEIQ